MSHADLTRLACRREADIYSARVAYLAVVPALSLKAYDVAFVQLAVGPSNRPKRLNVVRAFGFAETGKVAAIEVSILIHRRLPRSISGLELMYCKNEG